MIVVLMYNDVADSWMTEHWINYIFKESIKSTSTCAWNSNSTIKCHIWQMTAIIIFVFRGQIKLIICYYLLFISGLWPNEWNCAKSLNDFLPKSNFLQNGFSALEYFFAKQLCKEKHLIYCSASWTKSSCFSFSI